MKNKVLLGVNIDHVATIRQARGTEYPSLIEAASLAIAGGADGITIHLREDRRHIQDQDVYDIKENISVPLNLEIAVTEEMIGIALDVMPEKCCFVPEKREELTTEGGLDIITHEDRIKVACEKLQSKGIEVSLFIEPEESHIDAAARCGAKAVELHTGAYAEAVGKEQQELLEKITIAAKHAATLGLIVNAGHGLHYENTLPIAEIQLMNELNIGHSIVAKSLMVGMEKAVRLIKECLN